MALKRQTPVTNYQSQISVNRGSGYQALADASKERSNVIDSIVNTYATTALAEMKARGKKLGEEAAENVEFLEQDVNWTDPTTGAKDKITVRKPLPSLDNVFATKSQQETYDRVMSKRYVQEAQVSAEKIILEEKAMAMNNNMSEAQYDTLARNKLDKLYKVLPKEVSTLVQTSAEESRQSAFYSVMINYNNHIKKITDDAAKQSILETKTKLSEGLLTPEEAKNELNEYVATDYYKENKASIDSEITASQNAGALFKQIRVDDWSVASVTDLNTLNSNLRAYEALALGSTNSATVNINGTEETITRAELVELFGTSGNIDSFQNQVSAQQTKLSSYMTNLSSGSNAGLVIDSNSTTYNKSGAGPIFGTATKKDMQDYFDNTANSADIVRQYKERFVGKKADTAQDGSPSRNMIIELALANNVLPRMEEQQLESAFGTLNSKGITQLFQSGLVDMLLNKTARVPTTAMVQMGNDINVVKTFKNIAVDKLTPLGLSKDIETRIKYYNERVDMGMSIDDIGRMYQLRGEDEISITDFLAQNTGGRYTRAEFTKELRNQADKAARNILGHDPDVLFFYPDMVSMFEEDFITQATAGVFQSVNDDTMYNYAEKYFGTLTTSNTLETTNIYGLSSSAFSTRLSTFDTNDRNIVFEDDTKFLAKYPTETFFSLHGIGDTWIDPVIHDIINEQSMEVNDPDNIRNDVRIDKNWGKVGTDDMVLRRRLRLMPIDDVKPIIYNVFYLPENNEPRLITDKDTLMPLEIDLNDEYNIRLKQMIEDDIDKKRNIK